MASPASLTDDPLIEAVTAFVKARMANHDASHDFHHIRRVVGLAQHIASHAPPPAVPLDRRTVTLAALLHDVADRKYLRPGDDASALVRTTLEALGAPPALAAAVHDICGAVSWSRERADPAAAAAVLARHPELGAVQDADRLDALGAVGAARAFTYGAARGDGAGRGLEGTLAHFDDKLLRIEGTMKTPAGRLMARQRTRRLQVFKEWFEEEAAFAWDGDEGWERDGPDGLSGAPLEETAERE